MSCKNSYKRREYSYFKKTKRNISILNKNKSREKSNKNMKIYKSSKENFMNYQHKPYKKMLTNNRSGNRELRLSSLGLSPSDILKVKNKQLKSNTYSKRTKSSNKFLPEITTTQKTYKAQITQITPEVSVSDVKKQNHSNTNKSNKQCEKKNVNFNSKYKVIKIIGKGSNSSVYLCKHINKCKNYAVKKISKMKLLKENELKNFKVIILFKLIMKNEIKSLKKLKHVKEISHFKELLKDSENFYLIMEYSGETNLRQFLRNNTNLTVIY